MFIDKLKLNVTIIIILFINCFHLKYNNLKRRIGVIGLAHSQNVGNNLLKFAIYIKLYELGFSPYIIGVRYKNHNISFINNTVNIRLIKNFSEIKENDFDILMVNSDQTWRKYNSLFYDIAFLKFAQHWKKPKFIYGASLGYNEWNFTKKDDKIAKHLLSNFTGLSVREKDSVALIEKHLGFKAQFVLDPTFLINKKYYSNLINNYKSYIINKINNNNYIFSYILRKSNHISEYLSSVEKVLNIKIFYLTIDNNNQVKEFLYGIYHSKAVITDSFHGTIFSILFKKPFISFTNNGYKECRFKSLDLIFNIKNRIFNLDSIPPISLLTQPLSIDNKKLISLKRKSINYLKKNLNFKYQW